MAFKLLKESAQDEFEVVRIASQAYTIGDLVMADRTADAVDVVPATSASKTTNIYAVAMETVTSAATSMLVCKVRPDQKWVADATNTPSTNDGMQRMVLTDKATVNNTHTDDTSVNAVFQQAAGGGVVDATGKKIAGTFLISPIATS